MSRKAITECSFPPCEEGKLGVSGMCERHKRRARYERRRTQILERNVEKYHADPVGSLLRLAKLRAEKHNLPFSIDASHISIPTHCPVLGIPISMRRGSCHDGSPTIDRLIGELGYVPGNVAVISHRANSIKRNASVAELLAVAHWFADRVKEAG